MPCPPAAAQAGRRGSTPSGAPRWSRPRVAGHPRARRCPGLELDRPGPSYTVDTLEAMAAAEPGARALVHPRRPTSSWASRLATARAHPRARAAGRDRAATPTPGPRSSTTPTGSPRAAWTGSRCPRSGSRRASIRDAPRPPGGRSATSCRPPWRRCCAGSRRPGEVEAAHGPGLRSTAAHEAKGPLASPPRFGPGRRRLRPARRRRRDIVVLDMRGLVDYTDYLVVARGRRRARRRRSPRRSAASSRRTTAPSPAGSRASATASGSSSTCWTWWSTSSPPRRGSSTASTGCGARPPSRRTRRPPPSPGARDAIISVLPGD